jgi:hypothetical protein
MRQLGRSTVAVLVSAVFAAVATLVPAGPASASGYPWTVVPTPNSAGALETSLADTSCTPGGFCMAVGATNHGRVDQAFSEYMQDSPWAVVNTPSSSPNRANDLYGVSCVSASFCVAVGVAATSGIGQTLIEQWDGSTWKLLPSPDTNPGEAQQLQAVSCTSVTSCQAVGSVDEVAGTTDTLVESWNGATWSIEGSPDEGTGGLSELDGVSCPASTECTAVGSYFNGSVDQTLVESWNGTTWSVVPSPDPSSGTTSVLTSASCPLPTACTAVGYSAPGSTFQTLVERWNGAVWAVVPSPDTAPTDFDVLQSVSCASPTWCSAVGSSTPDGSTYSNLIEQSGGGAWTVTPAPPDPPGGGELHGVWCVARGTCTAVGDSPGAAPVVTEGLTVGPGYWLVAGDGGVFSFGTSVFHGSEGGRPLASPIVGLAPTPDRQGYWQVAGDGGIFSFGDAGFYGSMGGKPLNSPIVGIAPTPDGRGYWLVASDGGIFAFGDATFQGSMGGKPLNSPIVGMAATPDGRGYWLVASDGGIFAFGDATFQGSMGGKPLNEPIVGMAATGDGQGYWLVAGDGGIFSYGDATFEGSTGGTPLVAPIVGIG